MRKTIQIVLLVIGTVVATQAQTIIPKVGLSLSSTTATGVEEEGITNTVGAQPGFTLGVGYNISVGTVGKSIFSVQPELTFVQKGFSAESKGEVYDGEAIYEFSADQKFKINYLEIPVLAKLEFGSGNARFFAYAGPSLGLALGGKMKAELTYDDGYDTYKDDFSSDIKFGDAPSEESDDVYFDNRLDVGAQLGVGVTLFEKVVVDVRYGLGFTDLSNDGDSANRVLQFTVGMPLKLK